ncbi:MAG TPA: PQQ-binding-like beta-propeller repeat protein [Candidatus Lokiarchaeia archaeon]|nr:PQQ-binding-like beta-propeller repeat protein [Candidatus Lokiarchaeia archaeon]
MIGRKIKNEKKVHCSTFVGLGIILVLCMFVASSMPFLIVPGSRQQLLQGSPEEPRSATAPASSDSIGDEWSMFHGQLNHTGVVTTTPVQGTGLLWSYNLTMGVLSSPTIAGGLVYVGSQDHNVYCLNATTGAHVWNYTTGDTVRETSPAIASGRVYVGSNDNKVYCLNATNGSKIWSFPTGGSVESSPAVASGRVYVGSYDDKVYCLNATTGSKIWSYTTSDVVGSSPAVVGDLLYVGSFDYKIYCLDAITGTSRWNFTTGKYVWSSPAVAGGRLYVGSDDGQMYCLNATTGLKLWNYTTAGYVPGSPAVVGGRVYVGSYDHKVYCLNAITGASLWNYTTGANIDSSPAIANGRVFVGSWDDNLYCLNATTGAFVWSYYTGSNIDSSPAVTSGRVYVGTQTNFIICLPMIFGPSITHPSGITYTAGSTGHSISWTIMASILGTGIPGYTIYRNGTSVISSSWISESPVTLSIDGLSAGIYNYTIVATDGLGSSASDTVIVTVVNPAPSTPFDGVTFALVMVLSMVGLVAWSLKKKNAKP